MHLKALWLCAILLLGGCGSSQFRPWSVPVLDPPLFTDAQLARALPFSPAELHGQPKRASCLTMHRSCSKSDPTFGDAWVTAGHPTDPEHQIWVIAGHVARHPGRLAAVACPRGPRLDARVTKRYEIPMVESDFGGFEPGERGKLTRVPLRFGKWSGFACEKSMVYLWPEGEHSEPMIQRDAWLSDGHFALVTHGRSLHETEQLAREYLERLSAGAK